MLQQDKPGDFMLIVLDGTLSVERAPAHLAESHAGDVLGEMALGIALAAFVAARDHFFMATVGETGWPYLQHRGGPVGFLRVLDEHLS